MKNILCLSFLSYTLLVTTVFYAAQGSESLFKAARTGNLPLIKTLLEGGADVNARDIFGSTPLHWAALNGHRDVCEFLVHNKADINTLSTTICETPLHSLLRWQKTAPLKSSLILRRNNLLENYQNIILFFLADLSFDPHVQDTIGRTALTVAQEYGLHDAAELINNQPLYVLGSKKVVLSILCAHHRRCGAHSCFIRIDSEALKSIVLYLLSITNNSTMDYQNRKNNYDFYVGIGEDTNL